MQICTCRKQDCPVYTKPEQLQEAAMKYTSINLSKVLYGSLNSYPILYRPLWSGLTESRQKTRCLVSAHIPAGEDKVNTKIPSDMWRGKSVVMVKFGGIVGFLTTITETFNGKFVVESPIKLVGIFEKGVGSIFKSKSLSCTKLVGFPSIVTNQTINHY